MKIYQIDLSIIVTQKNELEEIAGISIEMSKEPLTQTSNGLMNGYIYKTGENQR